MLRKSKREIIRFLLTTNRVLERRFELADLPKGLWRLVDLTLKLVPLDPRMLMSQQARHKHLDRQLAWTLAFVAGAINAGGFLAIGTYTSHVTGALSRAADQIVLGDLTQGLAALGGVACFALGAFSSATLTHLGRRLRLKSTYAISLLVEGTLLLIFGMLGGRLNTIHPFFMPLTLVVLTFLMGMQNAMVTSISHAVVRTTHMTGMVTDLGIELSHLFFDKNRGSEHLRPVWDRLKLHGIIVGSFLLGALTGAVGFQRIGFKVTVIFAGVLYFLATRPILHDLRVRWRLLQSQGSQPS